MELLAKAAPYMTGEETSADALKSAGVDYATEIRAVIESAAAAGSPLEDLGSNSS